MKYIISIILFFSSCSCVDAQYYPDEIGLGMDKVYKDSVSIQDFDLYDHIHDSIERAVMTYHIQKEMVPDGIFNFPSFALGYYPSETCIYLLAHKYNIAPPIRGGCMVQPFQRIFDTLIANEIREKYGVDFFEKVMTEANTLDSNKIGLTLPCLKDKKLDITHYIQNKIPDLDSFSKIDYSSYSFFYIILHFKDTKITEVYYGEPSVTGIHPIRDRQDEQLKYYLNQLKWIGPKFKNKPVEKTVILNIKNKDFFFYGW